MIHYTLCCSDSHGFDGWFRDSAAFDQQAAAGLIACPECGSTHISRALMAPALPRKSNARREPAAAPAPVPGPTPEASPADPAPTTAVTAPAMPDALRVALQRLRAEVEKTADYVGDKFADEARRIHNGDSTPRPIYGETTEAQAEALADDGIEVARIPWIPRADS